MDNRNAIHVPKRKANSKQTAELQVALGPASEQSKTAIVWQWDWMGGSEFNSFSNDLCKFTIPNIHEKKMQEDERIVLRIIAHSKSTKRGGAVAKLLTTTAHQPVRLFVYCICLRLVVI